MNEIAKLDLNTQLAKFNQYEADLAGLEEKYAGVVYNLNDANQLKNAKADRHALGKHISSLDKTHKEVKEPLLNLTKKVDGTRKEIKDRLLVLQNGIKSQIQDHEAKLQRHQDELDAKVQAIRNSQDFDPINPPNSGQIQAQLAAVTAIEIDETYEDRAAEAIATKKEVIANLEAMLAAVVQREAEQAELAQLQREKEEAEQREREKKIAQEAAEAARIEAEKAAAKKIAAQEEESLKRVEDALRQQREAEEKAEREKAAAEHEKRMAAEEQERREQEAREAQEAENARLADDSHRDAIDDEVLDYLYGLLPASNLAKAVLKSLKDGSIPHVTINY